VDFVSVRVKARNVWTKIENKTASKL